MKKEYDFANAKRGAVIPQKGKTRISIYIDNDVLEQFRQRADASGRGYQTMMNEALREYLGIPGLQKPCQCQFSLRRARCGRDRTSASISDATRFDAHPSKVGFLSAVQARLASTGHYSYPSRLLV